MNRYRHIRSDRGFTMVEMIMVVVIIGILTSIAVPKFLNMNGVAQISQCRANRAAIGSAIAMHYTELVARDPSQIDWLENATMDDVEAAMFAYGEVPTCPLGGEYTLTYGNVSCSKHGN